MHLIFTKRLPNFIIIAAPPRWGKKTFARAIAMAANMPLLEATEFKVDEMRDFIIDAQTLRQRKAYLIPDIETMSLGAQNALLKFMEEPPKNAYIFATVSALHTVLPTIRSRAKTFIFRPYDVEELRHFTDDEELLSACMSPGQVKRFLDMGEAGYKAMLKLTKKLVDDIAKASAANLFKIPAQVTADDLDLFFMLIEHYLFINLCVPFGNNSVELSRLHRMSIVTAEFKHQSHNKGISKANMLDMYLVRLREEALQ
jgi:hypothetical protein